MSYPDNYSEWEHEERKKEAWLAKRPECSNCGHTIQDDQAYYINDEWICAECMERDFKKDVNDYA